MKDKYKELDNIFSKENKYEDEDDIPMKKYKVGISELGYEEIVEAEDEQEAEEMALIHCKQYLHEYVDVDTLEEVE